MAFANSSISDIVATTIESRSGKIADNVTKNNALLAYLKKKGNVRPVSGGSQILEELSFAENSNFSWYSGYDLLPVGASDVISAASFTFKQAAVPVTISGLELMQNKGKEEVIDLLEGRLKVAESTLLNNIAQGVYSDGTGFGGKQLAGLGALVTSSPTTGVVGGIDRASFTFWRNYATGSLGAQSATTIQGNMNKTWANLVRGKDKPDLIVFDNNLWGFYVASLQNNQRFTDPKSADLGFQTMKFMTADVVLDGGVGGFITSNVGYFLNTDYIYFRPHSERNMVPLDPKKRASINQDAEVQVIGWMGAMTASGLQYQGYFQGS